MNALQQFVNQRPTLFALLFGAYFVILWCVVAAVISLLGGWFQLSRRFRLTRPFDGVSDGMQSGQMRYRANYRGCLRLGANPEGLYLAVLFFFRFMHPPLFIPWSEITAQRELNWLFGESIIFTLGREERIPLRIRVSAATLLRDGAGIHWPAELSQ